MDMMPYDSILPIALSVLNIGINGLSILVSVLVIYLVIRMGRILVDTIRKPMAYFIFGVSMQTAATILSVVFGHGSYVFGSVHDVLMAFGMISTSISVYQFSKLILPVQSPR